MARQEVRYNTVAVYCQSCGAELAGNESFCSRCGVALRTGNTVVPEKTYTTIACALVGPGDEEDGAWLIITDKRIRVEANETTVDTPLSQIRSVRKEAHSDHFLFWGGHDLWIGGVGHLKIDKHEDLVTVYNLISSLIAH